MGTQISKELEEDVTTTTINGVVSESQHIPLSDATATPLYRRTPVDVAQRQQIFEFCADWDLQRLTDLLRWYTRFQDEDHQSRDSNVGAHQGLDFRRLHQRVDEMEREVQCVQVLIDHIDGEIASLPLATNTNALLTDDSEQFQGNYREQDVTTVGKNEQDAQRVGLMARRRSLSAELKQKFIALHEHKMHLLASIEDVNLTCALKWPYFIKAVREVAMHHNVAAKTDTREVRHPASAGYAMTRDQRAGSSLNEYSMGDILLPPPANHEVEGHTDDSASSSAASVDEEASDAVESSDGDASMNGDTAEVEANTFRLSSAGNNKLPHQKKTRDDDDDDDDGEDEGDEEEENAVGNSNALGNVDEVKRDQDASVATGELPSPTIRSSTDPNARATTPLLTMAAVEEHESQDNEPPQNSSFSPTRYKALLKRPRVIKRDVPDLFDASTRSPVFFGYSLDKEKDILKTVITEANADDVREESLFQAKVNYRRVKLDISIQAERGKIDSLRQREADLKDKRGRYWEKRNTELERAKKELDPSDIFFRTREAQDKKTRETENTEDEGFQRQLAGMEERIRLAQQEFDDDMALFAAVRSTDQPLGESRLKFHESEAKHYQLNMTDAKSALKIAKEEYELTKKASRQSIAPLGGGRNDAGASGTKNRAQLLFAEDQIRTKEKELETVCKLYEDELFLSKRAQEVFEREKRFLPFFECLQPRSTRPITISDISKQSKPKEATVLMMTLAILIGLGAADVKEKIGFLFKMFCSQARVRKRELVANSTSSDSDPGTISIIHRDAFAEIIRLLLQVFSHIGDMHPRQEVTRDYVLGIADREFLKLSDSFNDTIMTTTTDDHTNGINPVGMTQMEFCTYCTSTIEQSKYLSELLYVRWKYEELSRFVIQHMAVTQQYKLGLLNINDLKYAVARQSIISRAELSRWKKNTIHERAIAMGENDPLKTDYSKYLPRRHTRLLSNVVPLDHGGYRNLLHFRMEVILRATVKLQTIWRARKGRQLARRVAEKQAFYHARGVALREARDKIENEWREKDAKPAHTVEKMKFEAKIRMKQVKLRTKGNVLSREQVLAVMAADAVQHAQREVENRFREMEEELGYLEHGVALSKAHGDVEYLKNDISKALVAQVVDAKEETSDVSSVITMIALNEELVKKKKTSRGSQGQPTGGPEPKPNNQERDNDISRGTDDSTELHLIDTNYQTLRLGQTAARQKGMIQGRFPPELYTSGMTLEEMRLQMTLAFPDPPRVLLQERLAQICEGMTEFKMDEFLQELPSKRHICGYVRSFRRFDGTYDLDRMETDLIEHFRMVRDADSLAASLAAIAATDIENGWTWTLLSGVTNGNEGVLKQLVADECLSIANANTNILAKKLVRMGYNPDNGTSDVLSDVRSTSDNGNTDEQAPSPSTSVTVVDPVATIVQREQSDLIQRAKRVHDTHQRFLEAMRAWKEAEMSLRETQRQQLRQATDYPVLPEHRKRWADRFHHARCLPEKNAQQIETKYNEVLNVCEDFLATATAVALILIREYPLPLHSKSIMPIASPGDGVFHGAVDGRRDLVRDPQRLRYEAHDIIFKLCTDDHGRCEHSDEFAAKCGGYEVRNAALYLRALAHQPNLLIPLQCTVDFQGFRVLCSSKMPIDIVTWNEAGTSIHRVTRQLVQGTDNRGQTIMSQNRDLDAMLADAAKQLNLSRHGVRGYNDLTSKMLHAAADLRGYLATSSETITGNCGADSAPQQQSLIVKPSQQQQKRQPLVLLKFARAIPPEDPEVTIHLCSSTRGMSILWRQLRPELVASWPGGPLSPDALSAFTYSTPDWQDQAKGVQDATTHLLEEVIPRFAVKLSQKADYFLSTATPLNLTRELHRHGISIRHLGLLRAQFPFALAGTATLQYSTAEIQTTEDFTRQVERGAPLVIRGKAYTVSSNSRHRYDERCITLNKVHTGDSIQNIPVFAGRPDCQQHASSIRTRLLAEMVARTFKNTLRHFLREATRNSGSGLTQLLFRQIIIHALNLLTGSRRRCVQEQNTKCATGAGSVNGEGSESFWDAHLYEGIRVRFGPRAVSEVDRQNMRRDLLPSIPLIVSRVSEMMGIPFRAACMHRLAQHPDGYTFVVDDICDHGGSRDHYRVKHNLSILHFSMASLLLLQATVMQATSYKELVLADAPSGYWPLCERRGLTKASNLGTFGSALDGRYLPGCTLEAGDGPIVNTALNRSLGFRKEKRSYVSFPFVASLYPANADGLRHVTLEAWCRCDGHESTRRVVLTMGCFGFCALKANVWAFSVNVKSIDILAMSTSRVELGKWAHLVGTFDGTMLRLFVDGYLQSEVEVENVVDVEIAKREAVFTKTRQDIDDMEEEAKGKCFKEVNRDLQQSWTTKEGKKQIKAITQQLLDEHNFRIRLSKGTSGSSNSDAPKTATSKTSSKGSTPEVSTKLADGDEQLAATPPTGKRDLSKVSRSDFEALAKKQLIRETYDARVVAVIAEFAEMRRHVNKKITKELEEQCNQDSRELRIGCMSSPSRRDGKYFFHGRIAHVAYFLGLALCRDQINAHYVLGVRDRAHSSDDLFAMASTRFTRALEDAPGDQRTLEKFAENICASLKYDLDHQHAREMYKKKVRCGLQPFVATENAHGIAEILKNLPRDTAFSDLFVDCYRALLKVDSNYFMSLQYPDGVPHETKVTKNTHEQSVVDNEVTQSRLQLQELGRMPFAFFLGSKSVNSLANIAATEHCEFNDQVEVFADIIDKVLVAYPSFFGDRLTSMAWLRDLKNPKAIVYFILAMEGGEDVRYIDFKYVTDISVDDVGVIARNNQFALGLSLFRCSAINDIALLRIVKGCSQLELLDLSHCIGITDTGLAAIGKHCECVKRLILAGCHSISDAGIEMVVRSNPHIEELVFNFCERVSERCMPAIGKLCPNLVALELECCPQIGGLALSRLAGSIVHPSNLQRLNLAGCRRVLDDGLEAIARKCPRLRQLNVKLCDQLTDASLRVVTHNCLELESLHLEEVCRVTGAIFQFDQEGDGRGIVDKHLIKQLREVTLTGCAAMDDFALGYLCHRARTISSIRTSSCTGITDQGLSWLLSDLLDQSVCGTLLELLDVSYCPQLTAGGIESIVSRCPKLTSLNISGCIHLKDNDLVNIVSLCTHLTHLQLGFCRHLTDNVLMAIAHHLSLEELNVARCVKITDNGIREIASQSPVLRKLNMSACKKLTSATLMALREGCPLLEEIDATHCPGFSSQALASISRLRRVHVICAAFEEQAVHEAIVQQEQEYEELKQIRGEGISWLERPGFDVGPNCNEDPNTAIPESGNMANMASMPRNQKLNQLARQPRNSDSETKLNLPPISRRGED